MENKLFEFIAKYMPLSEDEKQVIIDLDIFKRFKKGSILLKEGDVSNHYYFVVEGCLRCYYIIDGEEKTTAFYTEAESFEPPCSVNNKPSEHYIACVEDSIVAVANADMQNAVFEKFPRFETLCRILTEELLAENHASLANFKTATPEQRYLSLLDTRPDLLLRVPQHQIASYLGIRPESLSRIRKRLVKRNNH